ncbi:MAG: aspartyl protease family protein [Cyclobacteriaceae bacterium]
MKKLAYLVAFVCTLTANAQMPITSIPFELYGDHIIIQVSIDDSEPLDFIFDTGSGLTVLDLDVADRMKLNKKQVAFNQTKSVWHLIKHNTLAINHFEMEKNIKVYTTDLNHLEISLGHDIDGILGYDLLFHHSVHINYDDKTMNIYDHGKVPKTGDAIPFDLNISIPVIKGSVVLNNNESHPGTFYVMTGAGTTLDFNSPYAEKYDVVNKTGKHYSYHVMGISEEESLHYEGHVLSLNFGKQKIEDLPIGISASSAGIQGDKKVSGIIGSKIWRMYNITIDVPDGMLYLNRNSRWGEKFHVNCSGIEIQKDHDKNKVLIHHVFDNSPASEAGIPVDSELMKVNGKTMSEISMADVKKLLRQDGETAELVVLQGGEEKSYTLKLRSLIK